VLRRGAQAGELRADTDVEVAALLLVGAVMARGRQEPGQGTGQAQDVAPAFVARAVDELLRGLASR
jgi:hypothetical protein